MDNPFFPQPKPAHTNPTTEDAREWLRRPSNVEVQKDLRQIAYEQDPELAQQRAKELFERNWTFYYGQAKAVDFSQVDFQDIITAEHAADKQLESTIKSVTRLVRSRIVLCYSLLSNV
jgi:hypothetical protein